MTNGEEDSGDCNRSKMRTLPGLQSLSSRNTLRAARDSSPWIYVLEAECTPSRPFESKENHIGFPLNSFLLNSFSNRVVGYSLLFSGCSSVLAC